MIRALAGARAADHATVVVLGRGSDGADCEARPLRVTLDGNEDRDWKLELRQVQAACAAFSLGVSRPTAPQLLFPSIATAKPDIKCHACWSRADCVRSFAIFESGTKHQWTNRQNGDAEKLEETFDRYAAPLEDAAAREFFRTFEVAIFAEQAETGRLFVTQK